MNTKDLSLLKMEGELDGEVFTVSTKSRELAETKVFYYQILNQITYVQTIDFAAFAVIATLNIIVPTPGELAEDTGEPGHSGLPRRLHRFLGTHVEQFALHF